MSYGVLAGVLGHTGVLWETEMWREQHFSGQSASVLVGRWYQKCEPRLICQWCWGLGDGSLDPASSVLTPASARLLSTRIQDGT